MKQDGLLSGPVSPSLPKEALLARVTTVVVNKVLPYLYNVMVEAPDDKPLPLLPNVFEYNMDETMTYKEFSQSSYSLCWGKVAMDAFSCKPKVTGSNILQSLEVYQHTFPPGRFNPSDNR